MSAVRLVSLRNPWFTTSVALTAMIAVGAAFTGFVWLPSQTGAGLQGVWDTICNAAGVQRAAPATEAVMPAATQTTQVVVTPQMLHNASAESIGRGATFALRCTTCHGARGLSEADVPNLAGQYVAAVYKQLEDFKSGARSSVVMASFVADLKDPDMRDLAAYYAYLPRPPGYHPAGDGPGPQIVTNGAPMRNIAACGSCHGRLDNKAGSAWLEGQPAAYLRAQLQAFASGARHNDISEQMRNIARQMTPSEIEAAAAYYANQP